MKKIVSLVLCIAMLLCVAPAALAVNEDVTGTVMIYTSMYQFVIDMMDEALKAEFPNLTPGNDGSFFFYGGTGSLQTKLAGIADGANKYVHPTHTAAASGLYKVTVDALGHVTATTKVTKNDITALGIPGQDTTYPEATTAKAGLMSAADKSKLDGMTIATDAEVSEMLTEVFGATA